MSAYVVTEAHIHALVQAGLEANRRYRSSSFRWTTPNPAAQFGFDVHELRIDNADEVGQMLWRENVASVRYRYPDDGPEELPGPNGFNAEADPYIYRYRPLCEPLTPVETLKAIDCYEYQTCEHPDWRDPANVAAAFCRALQDAAIGALPGYDEAPWEIAPDRPTLSIYRRVR